MTNQAYCPECETEMTKSIVGYLCHGCGNVHGFEKTSGDTPQHSTSQSAKTGKPKKTPSKTSSFARDQPELHGEPKPETNKAGKKKISHHIKKFVVPQFSQPELPAPTEEDHMLSAEPAELAPVVATASATTITEPDPPEFEPHTASKAMKEEFSADAAGTALAYTDAEKAEAEQGTPTPASTGTQGYLLPAVAGVLVVAALVVAFLVIR